MATAYELLGDGHGVTLLEAGELGQEATHGNAAKIALGECAPVPAPGRGPPRLEVDDPRRFPAGHPPAL